MTPEEFAGEFRRVARCMENGINLTPALEYCADEMLEGVADNFRQSQTSEGEKWPPRKDPRPTHPLLIKSGVLAAAARLGNVRRVTANDAEVGVSLDAVPYARRQQKGGGGILPRRYLGISEEVAETCENIIADNYILVFGR